MGVHSITEQAKLAREREIEGQRLVLRQCMHIYAFAESQLVREKGGTLCEKRREGVILILALLSPSLALPFA